MKKEKTKKEPKRKPKYGLFSCVRYIYAYMMKYERALAWTAILTIPVSLIISAIGLYLPPGIIRSLETSGKFQTVMLTILALVGANFIVGVANRILNANIATSEHFLLGRLLVEQQVYLRNRDFYLNYLPDVKKKDERGNNAIMNNHTAGIHFPMDFAAIVTTILKFFLFGSVISLLHPLIIVLLAVGCAINYFMAKWERDMNYKTRDARNLISKKINYLAFRISRNFKFGKDIRLYNLRDYIHALIKKLTAESNAEDEKVEGRAFFGAFISFLVVLVRDGAAYAFLIYKAIAGEVDAASFVLYFTAITSMSDVMSSILYSITKVQNGAIQISDYREMLETHGKLNSGKGIPLPSGAFSIEFKNVSFKYPEGDKVILDDISLKIEAGEKIALVGLNGAGKTTLTRLICGLIIPDSGEVLLDGHSVFEYNKEELYSLFGLISQNYTLLPLSIEQNITCAADGEEIDSERVMECVKTAGLYEKISSLPLGIKTPLNRQINQNAVELSGGETQKLLLARALYRDAKCLILDEPTAALDPIAEDKLYKKYNEMTRHATSIFISHRLASTRFCDRIFFLDGAKIAEEGTHESLMQEGGKYKELFDVQSKYYKEEATENE